MNAAMTLLSSPQLSLDRVSYLERICSLITGSVYSKPAINYLLYDSGKKTSKPRKGAVSRAILDSPFFIGVVDEVYLRLLLSN
jgi:hypothetical protein